MSVGNYIKIDVPDSWWVHRTPTDVHPHEVLIWINDNAELGFEFHGWGTNHSYGIFRDTGVV